LYNFWLLTTVISLSPCIYKLPDVFWPLGGVEGAESCKLSYFCVAKHKSNIY
jgi:hypothetical protein